MNARIFLSLATLLSCNLACADDWPQFRGPDGRCTSATPVPVTWSDSENLAWKTPLPGPGSSSPILWGDRVFVTCYSGYAEDADSPGEIEKLKRHLVCVDRKSGKVLWDKVIPARQPEDPYRGYITEHGYASSTPVTDGKLVYVFFGKTGVFAFDFEGKQQWQFDAGQESSNREWGSGASPVLLENRLIVNAAEESQSIYALDKMTGKQLWKTEAANLELVYNTPTIVPATEASEAQIVVSVPNEMWGLNPATGKMKWLAETPMAGNVSPSVLAMDGVAYSYGGYRGVGSVAFRTDGKGDVTDTHQVWTSKTTSYVATPVYHDGHLYWIDDRGVAYCVNAKTGEKVYQERAVKASGRPVYASPVLAGDKIYVVTRKSGTFVLPAKPAFSIESKNVFANDDSDFSGTPAVSDGQLFLRSGRYLYRISE